MSLFRSKSEGVSAVALWRCPALLSPKVQPMEARCIAMRGDVHCTTSTVPHVRDPTLDSMFTRDLQPHVLCRELEGSTTVYCVVINVCRDISETRKSVELCLWSMSTKTVKQTLYGKLKRNTYRKASLSLVLRNEMAREE